LNIGAWEIPRICVCGAQMDVAAESPNVETGNNLGATNAKILTVAIRTLAVQQAICHVHARATT
jgi:hypothetical protein